MNRNIHHSLIEALNFFIDSSRDTINFELFYQFVIKSFYLNQDERFSLCQLHDYLKRNEVSRSKELMLIYMHSLYILALNDDLAIYGNDFNV